MRAAWVACRAGAVMLAAGDTFRAAAVEQLQVWGQRNDVPVIAQATGADPVKYEGGKKKKPQSAKPAAPVKPDPTKEQGL